MDTVILSTGMAAVSLFCSIGIIWYLYRLRHPVAEKPKQPKAEKLPKPKKEKRKKEQEEEQYIFAVPETAEEPEPEEQPYEEPEPTEQEIIEAMEAEHVKDISPNIDELILAQLNGKSKMPKAIADEIGYPVDRVRRRLQAMVKKKQARHTAKGYLKAKAKV